MEEEFKEGKEDEKEATPWKWRLIVGTIMFSLALVGVLITMFKKEAAWNYWRVLSVVFAFLSLALTLYLRKHKWHKETASIWQEVFHWAGFVFSIFLLSVCVNMGMLTPLGASLQAVNLLFLATFLGGIYIEKTFLLIGGMLAAFVLILSYSIFLLIPLALIGGIVFYWYMKKKKRQVEEIIR